MQAAQYIANGRNGRGIALCLHVPDAGANTLLLGFMRSGVVSLQRRFQRVVNAQIGVGN